MTTPKHDPKKGANAMSNFTRADLERGKALCDGASKHISTGFAALHHWGDDEFVDRFCQCDPEVGATPCEYCALFAGLSEGKKASTLLPNALLALEKAVGLNKWQCQWCAEMIKCFDIHATESNSPTWTTCRARKTCRVGKFLNGFNRDDSKRKDG